MGDQLLRMGATQKYLREQYGVMWSRPYITKLVHDGKLRGMQTSGERGWWLISRQSIDDLLTPSDS